MRKIFYLLLFTTFFLTAQEQKISLYFDTAKDVPTNASLAQFNDWLSQNPNAVFIEISGFTDAVDSNDYNKALSERRVGYVLDRIGSDRGDPAAIAFLGEENATGGENAEDRRVDIVYVLPEPEKQPDTKQAELEKSIKTAKVGDKIRLANLNFYGNSDVILPESRPVLFKLLEILKSEPTLEIDIQGHICCMGTDEADVAGMRARAIYMFLVKNDISKSRLSYHSFGSKRPLYKLPEKNEQERIANRRVEIEIIKE